MDLLQLWWSELVLDAGNSRSAPTLINIVKDARHVGMTLSHTLHRALRAAIRFAASGIVRDAAVTTEVEHDNQLFRRGTVKSERKRVRGVSALC